MGETRCFFSFSSHITFLWSKQHFIFLPYVPSKAFKETVLQAHVPGLICYVPKTDIFCACFMVYGRVVTNQLPFW